MWAVASVWRTVESESLILSHGASDEIGLEGDVEAGGVVRKEKGELPEKLPGETKPLR